MTAEETLYTYHPIKHDLELRTDLWPTSTIVDAMEEYAAQESQKARREELERHRPIVELAKDIVRVFLTEDLRPFREYAEAALKDAGYETKEEQKQ